MSRPQNNVSTSFVLIVARQHRTYVFWVHISTETWSGIRNIRQLAHGEPSFRDTKCFPSRSKYICFIRTIVGRPYAQNVFKETIKACGLTRGSEHKNKGVLFGAVHQVKLADVVVDDFLNGGVFVKLVYRIRNLLREVQFL